MVGRGTLWKKEELEYLEQYWGTYSIKRMANKLGRSISAVKLKAYRIGLGDARLHFNGLTVFQLADVLMVDYKTIESWWVRFDFPVKLKLFSVEQRIKVVSYNDFWKWLKKYKQVVNFAKVEPGILGPEPEWMKEKRNADLLRRKKQQKPWNKEDDLILRSMVKAHCYTYPEIGKRLQRTEYAIKRRLEDLGINDRPVYIESHSKFTNDEIQKSVDLFNKGYTVDVIAEKLEKSALALVHALEHRGYRFRAKTILQQKETVV
ncbi:hypothetical protein V7183_10145 [Bacillus sp. JJ1127]|uniref:hypothetical protein n=1 Tax=Bacillus sp. JJ1127 TaxID=3122952 RepID=UPI002FFE8E9D